MLNMNEHIHLQNWAVSNFAKRVKRVGSYKDSPQVLKRELRHLLNHMDICTSGEDFVQARLTLIETLESHPLRHGFSRQWDSIVCDAITTTTDPKHLALFYLLRAKVAYDHVHREESLELALTAWHYARRSQTSRLISEVAQTLSSILIYHFGKPEKAEEYIREAKAIIQQLDDLIPYRLDISLGDALRRRGKIRQARLLLEDMAKVWFKDDLHIREKAIIQHNLGLIRWGDGDYAQAEQDLAFAISIYDDELNEYATACGAYGDLGLCLWSWGKLCEAELVYDKALELAREAGDFQREMKLHGNLGLVYLSQGKFDKAEACIREHIRRADNLGSIREAKRGRGNLAQLNLYRRGNPQDSLVYLEEAMKDHKHPSEGHGNDAVLLSLCWLLLGDEEKAKKYLETVWDICDAGEHTILPIIAYRIAAEIYPHEAKSHLETAYTWAGWFDRKLDMAGCLLKLGQLCDNETKRKEQYAHAKQLLTEMNGLAWLNLGEAPLLPLMI